LPIVLHKTLSPPGEQADEGAQVRDFNTTSQSQGLHCKKPVLGLSSGSALNTFYFKLYFKKHCFKWPEKSTHQVEKGLGFSLSKPYEHLGFLGNILVQNEPQHSAKAVLRG
jgi:hypothetical protein